MVSCVMYVIGVRWQIENGTESHDWGTDQAPLAEELLSWAVLWGLHKGVRAVADVCDD